MQIQIKTDMNYQGLDQKQHEFNKFKASSKAMWDNEHSEGVLAGTDTELQASHVFSHVVLQGPQGITTINIPIC